MAVRKFKYVGGEGKTEAFGITFPRGETVEISANKTNAHALSKLEKNPQFEEITKSKPQTGTKPNSNQLKVVEKPGSGEGDKDKKQGAGTGQDSSPESDGQTAGYPERSEGCSPSR